SLKGEARAGVQFVKAQMGAVSPATLLGLGVGAEGDMAERHAHHHHHHEDEDHDHDHDHDDFETFQVDLPALQDADLFLERVKQVIIDHDILRLKGFAQVGSKPMRLVIQAVGPRVDSYFDRPLADLEKGKTKLVVIGQAGLDERAIKAALQS
ncbi:MAG TPA: cobalamin biosynthesis protein CobW, partial [Aliiroseovarius sp.]|nr:cobalamin biosynthesis protein CobW [Aliiroseovarius sp.]